MATVMLERVRRILPVVVLATIGLGVSIALEVVHQRLAADVDYTSFCNVSAGLNCDVVLGSRYASLAGFSVSAWAIAFYLLVLVLAACIVSARRATLHNRLTTLTLGLAVGGLLFSLYMAVIAFAVLHTVCLMCSALYLVSIGLLLAAWKLHGSLRVSGRRQAAARARQERTVLVGSVLAGVALILVGSWEALGRDRHGLGDAVAIERLRPDFYRWFFAQPMADVSGEGTNFRGAADAPVTVVEFSDFACAHCAALHASLKDVLRRGANVRVVFRHFPLDSGCNSTVPSPVHPQACLAAVAAECAGEQERFWQYLDLLFDNQRRLGREFLIGYAKSVGLDSARFIACLGSEPARARVKRDTEEGAVLQIESTPTMFINGRRIKGALEPAKLSDAVTLAQSTGEPTMRQGLP